MQMRMAEQITNIMERMNPTSQYHSQFLLSSPISLPFIQSSNPRPIIFTLFPSLDRPSSPIIIPDDEEDAIRIFFK